jgi:hypothetical protein
VDVESMVEKALQSRLQAAQQQKASRAWEEFSAAAPEFLGSVQDDMQEILLHAGRQGKSMTYQQAYDRACQLNEEVSGLISQRKAAQAVRAPGVVTPAMRAAAGSVRTSPAAPRSGAQPKDIRGALNAAAEKLGFEA